MPATEAGPLLDAEHSVAAIVAKAERLPDVAQEVLAAIGEPLGWVFGAGWRQEGDGLRMVEFWSDGSLPGSLLAGMCAVERLESGEGLPGRVMATGTAAWIVDVSADPHLPRRDAAAEAGLRSAFAFPVMSEQLRFAGAIEFFTRDRLEPDERLLATMTSVGRRIGGLIDRGIVTRALDSSEATGRAVLEAALDCVITMDARGRVIEFNPAAERTFGYPRSEAIGRDMADLIVPPRLREPHRRGLGRYLKTGSPTLLDKRVEISAVDRTGREFPVELAITRIAVPGRALFTGHIRDISERKRAEAELRESRARVLHAADDERRRIERDLHDGAQQRLVALALNLRLARSRIESDPQAAAGVIDDAVAELQAATAELRELARGIHPAVLSDRGLNAALQSLSARSPVPVDIVSRGEDRPPPAVEVAVYFVVAESLTNVARYSGAGIAKVTVDTSGPSALVEVSDDGVGGADPDAGSGLRGLSDRVSTLGGRFSVTSAPGHGTTVRAEIPCA